MVHIALIATVPLHAGEPVTAGEYLLRVLLTLGAFGGTGAILYWMATIVGGGRASLSGRNRSDDGSP